MPLALRWIHFLCTLNEIKKFFQSSSNPVKNRRYFGMQVYSCIDRNYWCLWLLCHFWRLCPSISNIQVLKLQPRHAEFKGHIYVNAVVMYQFWAH